MNKDHVDSLDENCWCDLIDYSSLLDDVVVSPPDDLTLISQPQSENDVVAMDVCFSGTTSLSTHSSERAYPRKRGRSNPIGTVGTKAGRERMRREKLNDRFSELSAILEPGRPVKTDKLVILGDAIRTLNQLKTESKEYAEMNTRLLEEIKNLKAEKNEIREEKLMLQADKERIEQQLKPKYVLSTQFMPGHQPAYQAEVNKVPIIHSYGFVPMWHYLPPSCCDTTQDHALRPPAA